MWQYPPHLIGGAEYIVEAENHHRKLVWLWHSAHRRRERDTEGALGSHYRAREVEFVFRQKFIEVVTRHSPGQPRKSTSHFRSIAVAQIAQLRVQLAARSAASRDVP